MIFPQLAFQTPTNILYTPVSYIDLLPSVTQPKFPDRTKEALEGQAYNAEQARLKAEADAAAAFAAQQEQIAYEAPIQADGGLLSGSYGYALAGGNCVNEVPANERPDGNPITWSVTTMTPYIGAIALFPYNHVAIVTGIWSNGDIEVRQQNWSGIPQTRFHLNELRGFR